MANHQNNFATTLTSNTAAGDTTSPLNAIPSIDAPFYLAFDATNINGHYEVKACTSKTATNVNHAALSYAHTTAEEVRLVIPAEEADAIATGWYPYSETYTYASASTFTVPGNKTEDFTKGSKVKFTNNSATVYGYVVSSTYSDPNTTVTIASESTIANSSITNPFLSYMDCPKGFKRGQDWYRCTVTRADQTVNDNTVTKILFDNEIYDTNNNFDRATNFRYTVPISGIYQINASVIFYDTESKMARCVLYAYRNNTNMRQRSIAPDSYANASSIIPLYINDIINLTKGDYIEFFCFVDTTDGGSILITDIPSMSIQFIGV